MNSKERQNKYRQRKKSDGFDVVSKWVPRANAALIRRILNVVCGTVSDNPECDIDESVLAVCSMINGEKITIEKRDGKWSVESFLKKGD